MNQAEIIAVKNSIKSIKKYIYLKASEINQIILREYMELTDRSFKIF